MVSHCSTARFYPNRFFNVGQSMLLHYSSLEGVKVSHILLVDIKYSFTDFSGVLYRDAAWNSVDGINLGHSNSFLILLNLNHVSLSSVRNVRASFQSLTVCTCLAVKGKFSFSDNQTLG